MLAKIEAGKTQGGKEVVMTDIFAELGVKRSNISEYDAGTKSRSQGTAATKSISESDHALPKGKRRYGSRPGEKRLDYALKEGNGKRRAIKR